MSGGRGRGYLGRRHLDDIRRPGDSPQATSPPLATVTAVTNCDNMDANSRLLEAPVKPPDARIGQPSASDSRVGQSVTSSLDREPTLETDDEKALAELLLVEEQYRPIVSLLEQFNPGEDGIVFNRKLRDLETALNTLCRDDAELQSAFSSLGGAALGNAATARKLATVGASFTRQQRQNVLRTALLNIMQSTFAKLDVLERTNPQILTNAATLMGDYFTEARLSNGNKVHLLCPPLMQYMRSLLSSSDRRAHRALATQLMQNGRELLTTNAQDLDDLSISIRQRLLSPPPGSIVWLLLSADLCLNKFLPLPASLQAFYASNLDLLPESEQNQNYNEVQYGSWKKEERDGELLEINTDIESIDQNILQLNISQEDGSIRKLRPILGAGASSKNSSISEQGSKSDPPENQRNFNENPFSNNASSAQDTQDVWTNKTSLAKRYDLNSWRQQDNEEKNDDANFNLQNKFTANDNYRDIQAQNPPYNFNSDQKYQTNFNSKYPHAQSDYLQTTPPPFPPLVDGKFTTPPPPFVPLDKTVPPPSDNKFAIPPPLIERPALIPDAKFSTPPPFQIERSRKPSFNTMEIIGNHSFPEEDVGNQEKPGNRPYTNQERSGNPSYVNQERNSNQLNQERTVLCQNYQERNVQKFTPHDHANPLFERSLSQTQERNEIIFNQERNINQERMANQERVVNPERIVNQERNVNQERTANQDKILKQERNQDRTVQEISINPERTVNQLEKSEKTEKNRRPPENWRKEKPKDDNQNRENRRKLDWSRQKSKDSEDGEDKEVRNRGDGEKAHRNRNQRNRQNRKSEETEEPAAKALPVRRHAMEVPRSHKYWDHDDRLDKDYNS